MSFPLTQEKLFWFFKEDRYVEIDEEMFKFKKVGRFSNDFPGVPSGIDRAFRYTNDMLYFFQNVRYFEYSEFEKIAS